MANQFHFCVLIRGRVYTFPTIEDALLRANQWGDYYEVFAKPIEW